MKDKINILGVEWRIEVRKDATDPTLSQGANGFTRMPDRLIVIAESATENKIELNHVIRHEVLHAYLFEAGFGFNWEHPDHLGHDETYIDWFSFMYPKIKQTYEELECEE